MTQLLVDEALLEIDHIFVCLQTAPNQSFLRENGLICSDEPTYHAQQGTASKLIFFENIYIELIWVEDETVAELYAMYSGIDFSARSYSPEKATSPFGIALHQKPGLIQQTPTTLRNFSPQATEQFVNYAASNLASQAEPICFMIPESISFLKIFNPRLESHQKFINHPLGIKQITHTQIAMRKLGNLTNPISMLQREGIIEIEQDASPLLRLTCDRGIRGEKMNLQPAGIPIVIEY